MVNENVGRNESETGIHSTNCDSAENPAPTAGMRHSLINPLLRCSNLTGLEAHAVSVREEETVIPTYLPAAPDKNPMFLEKRVYQGSSGAVYPLPFTDRISETKTDRKWKAVWIENKFVRVMILPEIGGRIHAIQDKTNGYDLIYNQSVIKPALPAALNSTGRSIIAPRLFCRWIMLSKNTPTAPLRSGAAITIPFAA
jgi:hypothetical protein